MTQNVKYKCVEEKKATEWEIKGNGGDIKVSMKNKLTLYLWNYLSVHVISRKIYIFYENVNSALTQKFCYFYIIYTIMLFIY